MPFLVKVTIIVFAVGWAVIVRHLVLHLIKEKNKLKNAEMLGEEAGIYFYVNDNGDLVERGKKVIKQN